MKIRKRALTFEDVLLVPQYSEVLPKEVSLESKLTRNISLKIPMVSAAMDTVTEYRAAIAMARLGGIGIIHKNMDIEAQCKQVKKVKKSESGVIIDPIYVLPDATLADASELMNEFKISGVPVIDAHNKLLGILTNRDMRFQKDMSKRADEVMTKMPLITAKKGISLDDAADIMHQNKIEKLPIIDDEGYLKGLVTIKDIKKRIEYPNSNKDAFGRLIVGAAIGVGQLDRAKALVNAGCDVLVLDSAHGHSKGILDTVREIKKTLTVDVIAGNIATAEAVEALIEAGADGVKVGIGPGSICTTRVVAGIGVPQFSAVLECSKVCKAAGVALIADGGIKYSGDIVKALAAGADSVMIGSLFAGTDESPGEMVLYKGRAYKVYRGMGSLGAMVHGSKDRYGQGKITDMNKLVPEGIEGQVPHRGPLSQNIYQLIGGIKSGMGYVGASDLRDLQAKARFITISAASLRENHPHDVQITKEAPNYSLS